MPLCQYMYMFALKANLLALFGNTMKEDKAVLDFRQKYEIVSIILAWFVLVNSAFT